jgi:hypothetical protein
MLSKTVDNSGNSTCRIAELRKLPLPAYYFTLARTSQSVIPPEMVYYLM